MIALRGPGHKEITMADQTWTWPAGRVLVLYRWTWLDPDADKMIVGWSRRDEADDAGYIHIEAESDQPAVTLRVHPDGMPLIERETFSAFTRLPPSLKEDDGRPLDWVRALLGQP
jgi:hypothetical protein